MIRSALLFLALTACASPPSEKDSPTTPASCSDADDDADGLTGCEEEELGLDPASADTDGDGTPDGDELACLSDPLDADETCYACGWLRSDPGTLVSTGSAEGDTVANLTFVDQCGDSVDLWDFAGQWRLAFLTTQWCGACLEEAMELEAWGETYRADTGVDFGYLLVLFQDVWAEAPTGETAVDYAAEIGATTLPVLADTEQAIVEFTPFEGSPLPGKCLFSPEMVMVECWSGHSGIEELYEVMERHAR